MVSVNVHCPRCDSVLVYRYRQTLKAIAVSVAVSVVPYSN
ncbi:IS1 family transposase [Serratia fonticola]